MADRIYSTTIGRRNKVEMKRTNNTELLNIPDDYKIIDHGKISHYHGEHVPAWFE